MALLFGSYLSFATVPAPLKLTISKVVEEEVGRDRKIKRVVYFKEIPPGLVLCGESQKQLVEVTGSNDTDQMVGKVVEVFGDPEVKTPSGIRCGGVRIRAVAEKGKVKA